LQGKLVSVLSPVYVGDEFFGVVGFDLSLDAFIGEVNEINPTANGFSVYIDKAGKLLPTMYSESVETSAAEAGNESLVGALEAMRNGEAGQVRTRIGGSDVYVAFAPIEGLGGSLALVGPVDDVLDEAQAGAVTAAIQDEGDRTLRLTLLTMGALFVLGLITASYLHRRILVRPIEAMVGATRAVARGDLTERIAVSGNDELAALGRSFNAMSDEVMAARGNLERQVEERTRELTTLLTVSRNVASTLELRPLISLVIEEVRAIAGYSRGSVLTVEGASFVILQTESEFGDAPLTQRFPIQDLEPISSRVLGGEAVIVPDVRAATPDAEAYRRVTAGLFTTAFDDVHSWMVVPLSLKERVIGFLSLAHTQPAFYTERHAGLVSAIATQIAVAIENARLYEQAQHLAAVEERQRLARELHDSVSQALYGIALGARTARTLLDTDAQRATEPVDYVLQLADAGLAEMRALIFELRPESLESEGLVAALEKQIAATRARYGLEVVAELCDEPGISLIQKEVFYRVAQESLHNIVKHARATRVDLDLSNDDGALTLHVRDNGVGFDATQTFPGHMGLVSFNERAASIGAELSVDSALSSGTTVRLSFAPAGDSAIGGES
jgi:signal transduction histidine kinase